jgi:hypothetical protein
VSSADADRDRVLATELIERLMVDPAFRADFRRDPAAACVAAGLPDLAAELAESSRSMDTLVVRESRSSLAGVVMAVAVEGIALAEAQALLHHGLTGVPRRSLLRGSALRAPLAHMRHAGSPAALERELGGPHAASAGDGFGDHAAGGGGGAGVGAEAGGGAGAAGAGAGAGGGAAATAGGHPSAAPLAGPSPAAGAVGSAPPTGAAGGPALAEASGGSGPAQTAGSTGPPSGGAAAPAPPKPGAQPAHGGVVPTWPDEHGGGGGGHLAGGAGVPTSAPGGVEPVQGAGAGGGASSNDLMAVLANPHFSAPADARAFLTGGGADPRLVSVLSSALANHSIGLGHITALTDPVHAQAVTIVSVDGQPVGPNNVAARDLVTEIAALDPSLRPSEIGTPWPIHSPGFFSDPSQHAQLHLAFASSADYQPPSGVGAGTSSAQYAEPVAPPGTEPAAPVPAAESPATAAGSPVPAAASPAPAAEPAPASPAEPAAAARAHGDGNYVNPLPASARIGRTDMGVDVDLNPGDPIVAPGTSRVLGIMPNWYAGQPYVALQLLDGPMKGHNYYVAEQITPAVRVGQVVQQGQPIAHYAASGTAIEIGWAGANWEQTLAQAEGNTGDASHNDAPAGISFRHFLDTLGHGRAPSEAATGPDPDDATPPAAVKSSYSAPSSDAAAIRPDVSSMTPNAGAMPEVAAPAAYPSQAASAPAPEASPPPAPAPGGHVRATVQLLPAVQPGPGSPLYAPARQIVEAPAPQIVEASPSAARGAIAPQIVEASPSAAPDAVAPAAAAPTQASGVDAALAYARTMVGKLPESAGSNLGPQLDKFESDFGFHGAPWCGIFAGHVLEAAGLKVPHTVAAVASILDLARNGDPPFVKGVLPVSAARPGDLVTFGGTEHVAVVIKVDGAGVHTIAGNTSQSNVSETTYSPSSVTGVVRPDYAAGRPGSIPGVWQYSGARSPAVDAVASVPTAASVAEPPGVGASAAQQPSSIAFNGPASNRPGRNTVQFLPAVQASPGSPLYEQAPSEAAVAPGPGAADVVPEPGEAAVVPVGAAAQQPTTGVAVQPPEAAGVPQQSSGASLEQAAATATSGGSISVSSSLLTTGQEKFAGRLAELTGLDPRVIGAWELAEESGGAAQSREAASNFNWLNIGYFDSGPGQITFDKAFSDPISAAEQTAKFLEGQWAGASSSIRAILNSVGHSPDQQMAAIANSDWAGSHYGGGSLLHGTYDELGDIHVEKTGIA